MFITGGVRFCGWWIWRCWWGRRLTTRRYRSLQPTIILASTAEFDGRRAATVGRSPGTQDRLGGREIAEIEWYDPALIRPIDPERVAPALLSWVRGGWISTTGEDFVVLDGQAIFDRPDFDADV